MKMLLFHLSNVPFICNIFQSFIPNGHRVSYCITLSYLHQNGKLMFSHCMNRKFMVHWMGNIRNGDFYDEKKEGTLLSSGSPAPAAAARRTNRLPSQDFILTPSSRSRSMKKGARNCSMTVLPLRKSTRDIFPIRFRTAIFPKSTMRVALP